MNKKRPKPYSLSDQSQVFRMEAPRSPLEGGPEAQMILVRSRIRERLGVERRGDKMASPSCRSCRRGRRIFLSRVGSLADSGREGGGCNWLAHLETGGGGEAD